MTADNLSQRVSELSQRLEELKIKCVSDPANASEVLDDALDSLQASLEELSVVNEELVTANEELAASNEELRATTEELQNEIKNREQAEEALLESEKKYRILTENTPGIIQRFDRDLRILYISPQVEGATGMPPEKFIGKTNEELGMPPELCTIWNNLFHKVGASRDAHEIIFDFPVPKGIKTYLLKVVPEFATDGSIKSYLGISIDITKQMLAEKALKESEEKFRGLFDSMNEAIQLCELVRDDEGRPIDNILLDVNPAYETHSGFTRDQVIGRRIKEILPIVEQVWLDRYDEVVRTGKPLRFEEFNTSLDKWFEVNACPMKGDRFAAIFTDITDRKKAEEALLESEEKYRELIENANSIIIRMDNQGRISYFNEYAQNFFGYSLEEIVGQNIKILLPPIENISGRNLEEMADNILRNPDEFIENINENIKKIGEHIWISWRNKAIRNANGDIIGNLAIGQDITERKRAEEALRESEEKYRTLFNSMAEGFALHEIILDNEGQPQDYRFLDVNPAFERLTGLKREEVIGKTERQLFPDDDPQRIRTYSIVALTGQPADFETHSKRLNKHYEVYAHSPAPGQFASLFIDITERKQAEEALRESEAKFRAFFENSIDAILLTSPEGNIEAVNSAACQMFAMTEEEIIRAGRSGIVDTTDPRVERAIEERERTGRFRGEINHKRKDGTIFPGDVSTSLFTDRNGNVKTAMIIRDITERKQAEEALRKLNTELERRVSERTAELVKSGEKVKAERQRFLDMLDTLPVIIDIIRPDHQITWTNRAYREALGDNQGRLCFESQFGRDKPCDECQAFIPLDTGQPHHWEWTLPSGRTFDIYNFPFVDSDGSPVILEMDIDITERRKAEAALKDLNENLEVMNEELQAEISEHKKTEKELLEAKVAAEAAVEAKAAFLANMSHELRTPLNAVIGFSSLLMEDNLTDNQKEYIERIRTGGESLLALISDVLEFSRAEKGKTILEHQPLSLKHCIEESMDMVSAQADNKGLNLSYTISYGIPDTIMGDPGRLRQILVNLLSNAVKFTDVGDISVSVSSKVVEGNKRQFQFAVKDTGIGMPQDRMDSLFKPFTQLEYVISRKRDGAGLGLAICKELVEIMGGEIWAESEEGKGSTFRFTIQAEVIPGKQLDLGKKDKAAEYENLGSEKPLSILVAEDNPSNQRVLVEMLKRLGYRADAVADGREVLQALQIRPYDLIFMDIRMPEMDGLTATKEIRKLWPDNGPKVVAITAFAMDGDREKCLEAGADEYIAKPVKVDDLATLLCNIAPPPKNKN